MLSFTSCTLLSVLFASNSIPYEASWERPYTRANCCNHCTYRMAALTLRNVRMAFPAPSLHAESQSQWWVRLASLHSAHVLSWHPGYDRMAMQRFTSVARRPRIAVALPQLRGSDRESSEPMHHQAQGAVTYVLTGLPGPLAWLVHLESGLDPLWLCISLPLFARCLCSAAAFSAFFGLAVLCLCSDNTTSVCPG